MEIYTSEERQIGLSHSWDFRGGRVQKAQLLESNSSKPSPNTGTVEVKLDVLRHLRLLVCQTKLIFLTLLVSHGGCII